MPLSSGGSHRLPTLLRVAVIYFPHYLSLALDLTALIPISASLALAMVEC